MKKAQRLTLMTAAGFLLACSTSVFAADKAEYDAVKAKTLAEVSALQKEGIEPWNPTAKDPVLKKADAMAEKGDYAGAIKYAEFISSLQTLAKREWQSQPNPGPYKP
ncbi:hypothetical protein [Halothiobacillus sp. DCM-1]|uniref:hypothetical protein n=1 Tax=Halothiobacillus sp. DCM-1 TaxID=3112558 RepID=UPI003249891A